MFRYSILIFAFAFTYTFSFAQERFETLTDTVATGINAYGLRATNLKSASKFVYADALGTLRVGTFDGSYGSLVGLPDASTYLLKSDSSIYRTYYWTLHSIDSAIAAYKELDPHRITSATITGTTTKTMSLLRADGTSVDATFSDLSNSGNGSVGSITLNTPNVLFATPVNFSGTNGAWAASMTLNNQAQYSVFARGAGTGQPSFVVGLDSNYVTGLHTQNYYNGLYEPIILPGTTSQYWRGDKTWQTLNTSVVPESGSLYYTNARARAAVSLTTLGTSGAATYDNSTGVLNVPVVAGISGLTAGRIAYAASPTTFADDSTFTYDGINKRMRLGQTPYYWGTSSNNSIFLNNVGRISNSGAGANIAIGYNTLTQISSGEDNIAIGLGALTSVTTGVNNLAIGVNALSNLGIASSNVALGQGAGYPTTGGFNTFIGAGAGNNVTSGQQNILIGNAINAPSATGSGQISIGNTFYATGATANNTSVNVNAKAGVATNAPNSTFQAAGSFATAITTKTASYTATLNDYTILVDATAGAITITLPTSVGISGRFYVIKKIDASANAVTVNTTSSQTIDGATTYSLSARYKYVTTQSDNANWQIITNN